MLIKTVKIILSAIVAGALVFSALPAMAGVWSWSVPSDISVDGLEASTPEVVVDSNGLATAIWWGTNGENRIIQSSTSQSGGSWSTPVPISEVGGDGAQPQVTVDSNGLVTAIWSRSNGSNYIIQSSTRAPGGTWSEPVNLSDEGSSAFYPQITVDSTGVATAIWQRYVAPNYRVQVSTRPSGGTWTTPFNLSPEGQNGGDGRVVVDSDGLVTAIWVRNSVIQSSTLPRGGTWTLPVEVSVAGRSAGFPEVTLDSADRVIAIWKGTDGSGNRVVQSSTSLQGAAWSTPPSNLSTEVPYYPQVTVDSNGLATAAWSYDNGDFHIIQTSTSLNGASWTTPVNLGATADAREVELTVNPDGLVTAVFSLYYGNRIQATTSLNGAAWSTPVNLSDEGGSAEGQEVTVDATGVVTAIWSRSNGTNTVIQSSAFSAPTPNKRPVALPLVQAKAAQNPKVIGSPKVSKILKVNKQTWTGYPTPAINYQWFACTKEIKVALKKAPKSCKVIKGAKGRKFKLRENQSGKFVSVMVTGTSEGTAATKLFSRSTTRVN